VAVQVHDTLRTLRQAQQILTQRSGPRADTIKPKVEAMVEVCMLRPTEAKASQDNAQVIAGPGSNREAMEARWRERKIECGLQMAKLLLIQA